MFFDLGVGVRHLLNVDSLVKALPCKCYFKVFFFFLTCHFGFEKGPFYKSIRQVFI